MPQETLGRIREFKGFTWDSRFARTESKYNFCALIATKFTSSKIEKFFLLPKFVRNFLRLRRTIPDLAELKLKLGYLLSR